MNFNTKIWFKNIILKIILITLFASIFITNISSLKNCFSFSNNYPWLLKINEKKININKIQYFFEKKILNDSSKKKSYKLLKNKKYILFIYKKIISDLIDEILINNYMKSSNIYCNKNKIKEIVKNLEVFKKNNKFNKEKYFDFLQRMNINEKEYLNEIGKKIIENFFSQDILDSYNLLKIEKKSILKNVLSNILYIKAKLNFKKIFSKQNVTQKEIKDFYINNKKLFMYPKKFKIQFIKIPILINKKIINKKKKKLTKKNTIEKKIIKKINLISKNKKNYFDLIKKIINVKINNTKLFLINSIPQEIKIKQIISFLKKQKIFNKKDNIYYKFFNKNSTYIIKIINFEKEKEKSLLEVKKKIINYIKEKKAKIKAFKIIKKIENELKKGSWKTFNKNKLFFQKKIFSLKKNTKIFNNVLDKKINDKKPIYKKKTDFKKKWSIIKIYKQNYFKISSKKKSNIYKKYMIYNQEKLINLILQNLRLNADIKYQRKIDII
ncbi:MAG: hypothetical protein G8D24_00365 [Buchnera aphidicola (Periphyllus lyropictus)]|uniref:SurA N-terminal domain-containing protein n=1 Tax=Buchnera aphidicola TaxID=9 RepID=UPI001EB8EA67|nr:SurA N-terminal domain-containing protein [Buchnera aphidicola]NIH16513.1 hypothetical protein [Buchnera aphidicola (Periphyllus lyropictus)]USS94797.1 SurA N-terminal domain-containing protein [Buchnera aphidicola (Periphyllus lyropictus)]